MINFSVAAFLVANGRIANVLTVDQFFERELRFKEDDLLNKDVGDLFPGFFDGSESGSLYLKGYWIHYVLRLFPNAEKLLILVHQHSKGEDIYQFALDLIDIGIQIYAKDSTLVYLNSASEEMSGIRREDVLGKLLTHIYETDDKQSSVLSTLTTRAATYNKMDDFTVWNGDVVSVLNDSIPYFDSDGNLQAVVNLEFNQAFVEKMGNTIKFMHNIIPSKKNGKNYHEEYYRFEDIIGHSRSLQEAIDLAKMVAAQESSVFIIGETGTGKELIAQSIYSASGCRSFVSVNCSTISESLADAILFGTVKGAFTGSVNSDGLFAAADGGILFLDELNSLSLNTQARLLRVLQEGTYLKVGATKQSHSSVRVLASCNQDPWELMRQGKLRMDLFYRLASVVIKVPSLQERLGDLEELIDHFLSYYSRKFNKKVSSISNEALELLRNYKWPGNIRELKNVIEFAVNITGGTCIEVQHFPKYIKSEQQYRKKVPSLDIDLSVPFQLNLSEQMEQYEYRLIEQVLQRYRGNITKAAAALSLSRQALQYKLRKYHFKSL